MTVELNHTIIAAHDKELSALFYERTFGFSYEGKLGHFEVVKIPSQSLTLDFTERDDFETQHYAFKVNDEEFDAIFGRIKAEGRAYGSHPDNPTNGEINRWGGGRGVYFHDPNGHLLELLTRDYTPELFSDD